MVISRAAEAVPDENRCAVGLHAVGGGESSQSWAEVPVEIELLSKLL